MCTTAFRVRPQNAPATGRSDTGPDDSWPQVARRHSFAAMIGGRLCVYAVLMSLSVGRAYGGGAGQRFGAVCNPATEPVLPKGQAATGGGNVTKGLLPSKVDDNCRTVAILGEARGKKKKMKNTSMKMMVGAAVTVAFVVIIMFMNMITVTVGKAMLFTFIAKFLVSVNWIPSGSSSKKKTSQKDVTVLMQ